MPLSFGTRLGHYDVTALLGEGGMGQVQQAHDMVAAMEAANAPHRFVHYADRGHMRVTDEVIAETLVFIADVEGR